MEKDNDDDIQNTTLLWACFARSYNVIVHTVSLLSAQYNCATVPLRGSPLNMDILWFRFPPVYSVFLGTATDRCSGVVVLLPYKVEGFLICCAVAIAKNIYVLVSFMGKIQHYYGLALLAVTM